MIMVRRSMRPRRDMQKEMLNAMPTDLPLVKPGMGMITVSFKFFVNELLGQSSVRRAWIDSEMSGLL